MGLLSILPESFSALETWITRLFLLLGIICIGPWAALLVYDVILYTGRSVTHEIPLIGGRARGKARPRAPSLTERPSGHRRRFSLARRPQPNAESTGGDRSDKSDPRLRNTKDGLKEEIASS
ncbi:hypothetical protein BU24DRAFT_199754 [Aaosphaeria arxii CBS 175.79]|uniref:Uncharacterized protein n=1 Tax=Aaosphaeria arxii CBS 175.79 TaxID=1450172 RepID=A0A6A5XVQ1_9PLEO|nr:uncharacterized protein BU24DRAFT_199754 [Aaosphaeria arxii CBS 175.79]KAF2016334.1 hypothetical protein BU24DRAFT_199754 [Aaosphaeria arxii CBS 175.79]